MKKGMLLCGSLALLTSVSTVLADDASNMNTDHHYRDQSMSYDSDHDLYHANELSIDAFGTDTLGRHTISHISTDRVRNNSVLGAGIGVNYFFCRYLGVGGDAYTENTAHSFVDNASGNIIFRFPIGQTGLAPYAYGGAGYKFDPVSTVFGQAGGGLEFRFIKHLGIFVDARYVFADRIRDYGVGRAGLRWAF